MRARFFSVIFILAISVFLFSSCSHSSDGGDDDSSDVDDTSGDDTGALPDDDTAPPDPQDSFLNPTKMGPYLVGNTTYVLEDPNRKLHCGPGNRRLVVEAWYPASDDAADWPENVLSDFFNGQDEAVLEILEEHGAVPPGGPVDYATGSYRDAPLSPDAAPMPLLVFSHGFTSNRFQNYTMSNYLASHGYLVVAPDHTCNSLVAAFPDGVITFSLLDVPISLFEREGDVSFLVDIFAEQTPEKFAGRVDTDHIGYWGHSFGGITVSQKVKTDLRVSAMLQLASFGLPDVPEDVTAASMYFMGWQDKVMHPYQSWHDGMIANMPTPKYELRFFDTGHFAFSDLCLYAYNLQQGGDGCGEGTRIGTGEPFTNPDHDQLHKILSSYATAFFGAVFFDEPSLFDYIGENRVPNMMTYAKWE